MKLYEAQICLLREGSGDCVSVCLQPCVAWCYISTAIERENAKRRLHIKIIFGSYPLDFINVGYEIVYL